MRSRRLLGLALATAIPSPALCQGAPRAPGPRGKTGGRRLGPFNPVRPQRRHESFNRFTLPNREASHGDPRARRKGVYVYPSSWPLAVPLYRYHQLQMV